MPGFFAKKCARASLLAASAFFLAACGHAPITESPPSSTKPVQPPKANRDAVNVIVATVLQDRSKDSARQTLREVAAQLLGEDLTSAEREKAEWLLESLTGKNADWNGDPAVAREAAKRVKDRVFQSAARAIDSSASPPSLPPEAKPNVILISIDTTRADAVGAYSQAPGRDTPNIDELARRGVLFENAFANSNLTPQSHMSMLTGLYPTSHQVFNPYDLKKGALRPNVKTLAQILRSHGYKTAAFAGAFPMLNPNLGFARGFDEFYNSEFIQDTFANPRLHHWIQENGQKPFFLFLHSWSPHSPYLTPFPFNFLCAAPACRGNPDFETYGFFQIQQDFNFAGSARPRNSRVFGNDTWENIFLNDGMSAAFWSKVRVNTHLSEDAETFRAAYQSSLSFVDLMVGRLILSLKDAGIGKNTIIVITSDHGEEFLDHGNFFHQTGYNEILRVPLIFFDPRMPEFAGRRVRQIVESVDIAPTLLSLTGAKDGTIFDGRSLLPVIREENAPAPHPYAFAFNQWESIASLQSQRWKLLFSDKGGLSVFHLKKDPGEQHPRKWANQLPREVQEMKSRLEQLIGKKVN